MSAGGPDAAVPLAPYAASDATSRGRRHAEPAPHYRGEFQRDRDRIVHCTSFRRLVYKTQVYVNHEGDLYRTRITHSMEVAQIGRTVARALGLHETLTEAICLAHDLGHTPFGHAGQDALNECMREYGGFEHNLQSLRIVDELEERYAEFRGLNLTFETREGILKHCSAANARRLGDVGERFLNRQQPTLEAQLANLSDEIAYNNHDLDDGLRAGLIRLEQVAEIPLFARQYQHVTRAYPGLGPKRTTSETIRGMIDHVVQDLIQTTAAVVSASGVRTIGDVRASPRPLVGLSEATRAEHLELKAFLRDHVYRHYRVLRMTNKARRVLRELFEALMSDIALLPPDHCEAAQREEAASGKPGRARIVADYVAGMTDRYAILEHRRLFNPDARS